MDMWFDSMRLQNLFNLNCCFSIHGSRIEITFDWNLFLSMQVQLVLFYATEVESEAKIKRKWGCPGRDTNPPRPWHGIFGVWRSSHTLSRPWRVVLVCDTRHTPSPSVMQLCCCTPSLLYAPCFFYFCFNLRPIICASLLSIAHLFYLI